MKRLYIGNNGKEVIDENQNALVPYKGDGAVVPFEVFDPIQKRRPRPKVDLDPETNRLWNLLMGKEASEGAETMNDDKQKFWEEERKVFRGRVDSFIARMHLVQGILLQWQYQHLDANTQPSTCLKIQLIIKTFLHICVRSWKILFTIFRIL